MTAEKSRASWSLLDIEIAILKEKSGWNEAKCELGKWC